MPDVAPATVETLVAAYAAGVGAALAAAFEGERGNPVLFDRRFFDALTDVTGDVGGRQLLLESDESALVAVADSGVRRDVDIPEDL
jgi:molybdenum cofactor cytidylyltransferase